MHSWWHLLMKRCGSLIGHAMPVNIHQDNLGMKRLKEVRRLHSCIHIHINWSRRRSRDKAMHIIYMIVPFKIVKPLSHGDFTTGYGFVGIVTEVVHVMQQRSFWCNADTTTFSRSTHASVFSTAFCSRYWILLYHRFIHASCGVTICETMWLPLTCILK